MAHDLFISHSSEDKAIADAVCSALEAANIRCWVAPRDILPGQDWPDAIVNAIKGSRIMVLIFSSNSKDSAHVKRELTLAMEAKVIVIPLKIDDIPFEGPMQYFLTDTHWLDAMNPPTEKEIQRLVETVQVLITDRKAEPTPRDIHAKEEWIEADGIVEARQLPKRRVMAFVIAAVAMAAIAISSMLLPHLRQTSGTVITPATEVSEFPTSTFTPRVTPTLTPTLIPTVDVARFELLAEFSGSGAAWSPDGARFAWVNPNGSVHILDTEKFEELMVLEGYSKDNARVLWSPDGGLLTIKNESKNGSIYILDASSGEEIATIGGEAFDNFVFTWSWSPDSTLLVIASGDIYIYFRDGNKLTELAKFDASIHAYPDSTWSPDGNKFAAGSIYGLIYIWDSIAKEDLTVLDIHPGIRKLDWSPNGTKLAFGGEDTLRILDASNWEELAILEGHTHCVASISWSPDSTILASGSEDGTVRVWDTSSGKELAILDDDVGFMRSVTWSPNGNLLAAGGGSYVFIWDTSSWEILARFGGYGGYIRDVSWSIDGKRLSAYSDYYVYIWGIPVP